MPTITEGMALALRGVVMLELGVSVITIGVVGSLIVQGGWRRRYIVYFYELGLAAFYTHFVVYGPPTLTTELINLLYWGLLCGTAPANIAPLSIEWGRWLRYGRARRRCGPWSWGAKMLLCGILTVAGVVASALFFYVIAHCFAEVTGRLPGP